MPATAKRPTFSERLRRYSRTVSTKLQLNRQTAGKAAAVTAAAGATMSAHQAAEAAIVYSGPVNLAAAAYYDFARQTATFSIDGLANFGISAAQFPSYYLSGLRAVAFGTTGSVNSTGAAGAKGEEIVFAPGEGGQNQPDRLGAGATIDGNSPWFAPAINPGNGNKLLIAANNYSPYSAVGGNNWPNPAAGFAQYPYGNFYSVTGFAGVRFDTAGGAAKHNGWVRLRLTNNGFGGFTPTAQVGRVEVVDWAYNSAPDAPIAAGQIPEPTGAALGGLGALALGASSVRRIARQRRSERV